MTTFTKEDRISAQKERMKDISEYIILARNVIGELEQLIATPAVIDGAQLFKKAIELDEIAKRILIESDKIGNARYELG